MPSIIKARGWSFIAYPESLPSDWIERIEETGVEAAISPLHDKDIYSSGDHAGATKKPHYHVIVAYPGPTTYNAVKTTFCDPLRATSPKPLVNIFAYYEYLTHKNDPDKAQYEPSDIRTLNGFNYENFKVLGRDEEIKLTIAIHEFIIQHEIMEYCDLLDMLLEYSDMDMYEFATKHTILFNAYCKSAKYKNMDITRKRLELKE